MQVGRAGRRFGHDEGESTEVDSGRRTWPLTGMVGTDMPPFRIAIALFFGCALACAGLITGTASAQPASGFYLSQGIQANLAPSVVLRERAEEERSP